MTYAEAKAHLSSMVQATVEPTLSSTELDDLLTLAQRPDAIGNLPYMPWRASSDYAVGDLVVPFPRNGHLYKVDRGRHVRDLGPHLAHRLRLDRERGQREADLAGDRGRGLDADLRAERSCGRGLALEGGQGLGPLQLHGRPPPAGQPG
jgi:hypothetical protein